MTETIGVSDSVQKASIDGGTIITVAAIIGLTMLSIAYFWSPEFSSVQERERIYIDGFNAGWLNAQDCVSWAVEVQGAANLAEAFYWANYECPFDDEPEGGER